MKRILAILLLIISPVAFAQDKKENADDYNTVREFKNKVFDVHNRDPREIRSSIMLLGSGFKGSGISINSDLRTITVRDFPENIAAIEDAIRRLDRPGAAEPDIELKIWVLIGSKSAITSAPIPEDLAPVVKQLQNTLRYANYGLMTDAVQRTRAGRGVEGSGVADAALLSMTPDQTRPILYSYHLNRITLAADKPGIDVETFTFSMRVPIRTAAEGVQYQSVGFETPVSIRANEKVVIGTTTMGEKALIVVVTAKVEAK